MYKVTVFMQAIIGAAVHGAHFRKACSWGLGGGAGGRSGEYLGKAVMLRGLLLL